MDAQRGVVVALIDPVQQAVLLRQAQQPEGAEEARLDRAAGLGREQALPRRRRPLAQRAAPLGLGRGRERGAGDQAQRQQREALARGQPRRLGLRQRGSTPAAAHLVAQQERQRGVDPHAVRAAARSPAR